MLPNRPYYSPKVRDKPVTTMSIRTVIIRYKEFICEPGTIVTLLSGMLLAIAIILYPAGMFSSDTGGNPMRFLYLAAAVVGSAYIWWSAVKDVLAGDFTADVPVSIATAAAILIGQYPAAAVVAVLLLVGGMMEDFVAARADNALEALAKLLPDRVTVRRGR